MARTLPLTAVAGRIANTHNREWNRLDGMAARTEAFSKRGWLIFDLRGELLRHTGEYPMQLDMTEIAFKLQENRVTEPMVLAFLEARAGTGKHRTAPDLYPAPRKPVEEKVQAGLF